VLGELLDLLHHLLDRGADLRGDGVDREVEDKGQRAIGRGLHGGDDLVGVDEEKAAGENVDAAAAGLDARHLERAQLVGRLRGEADPEVAARIIAALLPIIGDRASGIGRPAKVGEEGIELAVHIGLSGLDAEQIAQRQHGEDTGQPMADRMGPAHQKSLPGLTLVR
jgi:hypothetical protein